MMHIYSKFWPKGGLPGILHHYAETLVAFEYTSTTTPKPHSLLFIGGLGDGLSTTSYTRDLVSALEPTEHSLFTLTLTSSYQSWGLGHLDRDTDEIARCVHYIADYKLGKFGGGKITLMGHSTGSQMVLHYLSRSNPHTGSLAFDPELKHVQRLAVDGAIVQAPVSDREALQWVMKEGLGGKSPEEMRAVYDRMLYIAQEAAPGDQSHDSILPLWITSQIYPSNTPISCRRFMSLASPESPQAPTEDDMFSSDLSDEELGRTFGMVQQRGLLKGKLLVLSSGADQSVPDWVDKEKMLSRWKRSADGGGDVPIWDEQHSGVIPGASHALSNNDQAGPRKELVRRVLGYLQIA